MTIKKSIQEQVSSRIRSRVHELCGKRQWLNHTEEYETKVRIWLKEHTTLMEKNKKRQEEWENTPIDKRTTHHRPKWERGKKMPKPKFSTKGLFSKLGYTPLELLNHLESKFTDGMSWDNLDEWHIDHIIPNCTFDYVSMDCISFRESWALKNLQPLWAEDNLIKGDSNE